MDNVNDILLKAYRDGFKVQSDFARQHSQAVAMLASLGYLSTREGYQQYGRTWRITELGLRTLEKENIL